MNRTFKRSKLPAGWRDLRADNLVIRNARIIDPSLALDKVCDLHLQNGFIKVIGTVKAEGDAVIIDASGMILCPGFFDMHVHLREPGYEYKETVQSGCIAATAGGFTGLACMPNTNPTIDNPGVVEFIREKAEDLPVDVHPVSAVTVGRNGKTLVEIAELCDAGVTGFSDDGSPVESAELMRRALEYSSMCNAVIIEHCEDSSLTAGGVMDEGEVSTKLGLPGWPSIGEEIAVERNIRLAEFTGGRLHIAHVSTARSADIIRQAKSRGVNVTAEVTPHHLTLTSSCLESYNTNFKVNPPLRTEHDIKTLIEALSDGTIDAIATDHAPHAWDEKEVEFINAPFGMTGLETALGVVYTKLVATGKISLERMIESLTTAPRSIMNIPAVKIQEGQPANLTLFKPDEEWTVDRNNMESLSRNTPFHGWELTCRVHGVFNKGISWMLQS